MRNVKLDVFRKTSILLLFAVFMGILVFQQNFSLISTPQKKNVENIEITQNFLSNFFPNSQSSNYIDMDISDKGIFNASMAETPIERLNDTIYPNETDYNDVPWLYPYSSPSEYFGMPHNQSYYSSMNFYTDYSSTVKWLQVEFPEQYNLSRLELYPYISTNGEHQYYPIDFDIEISNDSINWNQLLSITGNSEYFLNYSFSGIGRFIRLMVFDGRGTSISDTNWRIGTVEMKIFASISIYDIDSDNDGLSDGVEKYKYFTNITNPDTDYDGLSDYDECIKDNALKFDGVDDYINTNYILNPDLSNSFSITFWLFVPSSGYDGVVFGSDQGSLTTDEYRFNILRSTNQFLFRAYGGTGQYLYVDIPKYDEWLHIVCMMDKDADLSGGYRKSVYIDGQFAGGNSLIDTGGSLYNSRPLYIGCENSLGSAKYFATFYFDEFRIYNRELSLSEIIDLKNNTNPADDMVLYYDFENTTGDICHDQSENGYDGTLYNFPSSDRTIERISTHTDPLNPDTDSDNLLDGDELNVYNTDPANPDSDGDELYDGDEIFIYNTDPNTPDNIPQVDFSYDPINVKVNDTVSFTDLTTRGNQPFTEYHWDFGDGEFSNLANPTHIFNNSGDFIVQLSITDNDGDVNSTSKIIHVEAVNYSIYIEQPTYLSANFNETLILSWTPYLYGALTPANYEIIDVWGGGTILSGDSSYFNGTTVYFDMTGWGPGLYCIGVYFYTVENVTGFCNITVEIFDVPNTEIYIEQPTYLSANFNETLILSWTPYLYGALTPANYEIIDVWGGGTILGGDSSYFNGTTVYFDMTGWGPGLYCIGAYFYTVENVTGFCNITVEIFDVPIAEIYVEQPTYLSANFNETLILSWTPYLYGALTPANYEIVDVWGGGTILGGDSSYFNGTAVYFDMTGWGPGLYCIGAYFYTVENVTGFCNITVEIFDVSGPKIYIEQPTYLSANFNETLLLSWTPYLYGALTPANYEIVDVWGGGTILGGDSSYFNGTAVYFDMTGWGSGLYCIGAYFYTVENVTGFCNITVEIFDVPSAEIYVEQPTYRSANVNDTLILSWTPYLYGDLTPTNYEIVDVWGGGTILAGNSSYSNGTTVYFDMTGWGPGLYCIGAYFYTSENVTGFCNITVEIFDVSVPKIFIEQPTYISVYFNQTLILSWTPYLYGVLTPTYYEIVDVWGGGTILGGDSSYSNGTTVYFDMTGWGPGLYCIGAYFYTVENVTGFCNITVEIFPFPEFEITKSDDVILYEDSSASIWWIPHVPEGYTPTSYQIIELSESKTLITGIYQNEQQISYLIINWNPGVYEIGIYFFTKEGLTGISNISVEIVERTSTNTTTDDTTNTTTDDTTNTSDDTSNTSSDNTSDDESPFTSPFSSIPGYSLSLLIISTFCSLFMVYLFQKRRKIAS
ncbi:MAG: PKD domain-containing protein [Candidatus Lokiarchaeota archaeon]|nr:PKD domain-containing protein [Candidatus Harpocratesius repetitus]